MALSIELRRYLKRIGFEGTPKVDLASLMRIHQLHADGIAYENLDIQLARPVSLDPAEIFAKMVGRRRGGWCYEMNGLLGWALEEIGFRVTRLAGAVMRETTGDGATGNHLVLLVDLGELYIADVGFGDGIVAPAPLKAHTFSQRGLPFSLSEVRDGWWRFHNHPDGSAPSFDFRAEPAGAEVLARKCAWLQGNPDSPFVLNAVCQRYRPDAHYTLRGRILRTLRNGTVERRLIADADDYVETLRSVFDLDLPEARDLWPNIAARHRALFSL
jgi:N-hydroxyarylamine O-acetyltransferase